MERARSFWSRFGWRVVYLVDSASAWAARNPWGLAEAHGEYPALPVTDDEWFPEWTLGQAQWPDEHPGFGMVLWDVLRVTRRGRFIDSFQRREFIPEDRHVLRWVRQNPLAPFALRRVVAGARGKVAPRGNEQ